LIANRRGRVDAYTACVLRRFGPQILVVLLVLSTGVAFAVTERLKLEKAPIYKTEVTRSFSPACRLSVKGCIARASISFFLRRSDRVTVTVLNSNGDEVRTLLDGKRRKQGKLQVVWNGQDGAGRIASDGSYRVRVHLANRRSTITLPNVIELDTTAPKITLVSVKPRTISPDGDGRSDAVHIVFTVSGRARALLYADGRLVSTGRLRSRKIDWQGKIGGRLRLGRHRLTLRAEDEVGNLSLPTAPVTVDVRILRLRPLQINTTVGAPFSVGISTDRRLLSWRFAGKTGFTTRKRLFLRAPDLPGQYWLLVHSGPYGAGARVNVS
jgi:hypothetical protein